MAKKFAMILGWILVVVGILGFFSNPIVGSSSSALFMADTAHNLVHIITGAILLWAAYSAPMKAAGTLKVFGVIYLLLAIIGFFSSGSILGLVMANNADNWLHLIFGILFFWGGMSKNTSSMPMGQM